MFTLNVDYDQVQFRLSYSIQWFCSDLQKLDILGKVALLAESKWHPIA